MKISTARTKQIDYCEYCEQEIDICKGCGNYFHSLTLIYCDEENDEHYCECCKNGD